MSTTPSRFESGTTATEHKVHVVGGCHVGRDVATRLASQGYIVHLHDPEPPSDHAGDFEVSETRSFDAKMFADTGLDNTSTLFAVNPSDSTNLLLAQVARTRFGVDRVVARVNDPRRLPAFEAAGIHTINASKILGQTIANQY